MEDKIFNLLSDYPKYLNGRRAYRIFGLTQIFHKDSQCPVIGAVALLRTSKHPGCCRLMFSYCDRDDDALEYRFMPAYTKEGNPIYLNTERETRYALFNEPGPAMGEEPNKWNCHAEIEYMDDSIYDETDWFGSNR